MPSSVVTRSGMLEYLQNLYGTLVTQLATGQTWADTIAGVGIQIDNTLREYGIAEANLASPTIDSDDSLKIIALLEYYGLEKIVYDISARVDITQPSMSAKQGQLGGQLDKLLKEKLRKAQSFGYLLNTGAISTGKWDLGSTEVSNV